MATGNRTLKLSILADVDDLKKKLNAANNDVETSSGKLEKFGKAATAAFVAAAAAAGAMAVKIGVDAVKAASDLSEEISKSKVIFGDGASQIEAFAAKAAKSFGQTKQQAIQASSSFAVFGKAAGLAGQDLVKFSTDFTGLASDLASFNNTSPEDAIQAIGAALRGEAEPLRRYGVLLNDATLKQAAMELGIYSGNGALTAQQKVLAAQRVIYQQTTDAQGDFARTSDGLANKQRILTAEFENIKAKIGQALLPIVLQLVTFITDRVIPNLQKFADFFKPINDAIISNKENFQEFVYLLQNYVLPVATKVFGFMADLATKVASTVINVFGAIVGAITPTINFIIDAINKVITGLNYIKPGADIGYISKIGAGAVTGASSLTAREAERGATASLPTLSTPSSINVPSISSAGKTIPKTSAAKSAAQAAADMAIVATYGATATTNEALRSGILPTPGVVINNTFNGPIDAESSARQIVDVLNQSYGRGGVVVTTPFAI